MASQIAESYEKVLSKVDISRMFEGKPEQDSFSSFETLTRIGQAMETLRTHFANKETTRILKGDPAKTLKTKV